MLSVLIPFFPEWNGKTFETRYLYKYVLPHSAHTQSVGCQAQHCFFCAYFIDGFNKDY